MQVEQIQLTLRSFEVVSDIEQYEVNLGAKVAECVGLMDRLSRLHYENEQIRSRLSHLAAEASRAEGLQYHAQFQFRISSISGNTSFLSHRRPFRRPLPSSSRPFQRIGNAFYTVPSLTSSAFNTVWQAVHTGIFSQRV